MTLRPKLWTYAQDISKPVDFVKSVLTLNSIRIKYVSCHDIMRHLLSIKSECEYVNSTPLPMSYGYCDDIYISYFEN